MNNRLNHVYELLPLHQVDFVHVYRGAISVYSQDYRHRQPHFRGGHGDDKNGDYVPIEIYKIAAAVQMRGSGNQVNFDGQMVASSPVVGED